MTLNCLCFQRALPLLLVLASVVAQYGDEYSGYENYHHKAPVQLHQHQSLDEHHGEEYELDYHVSSSLTRPNCNLDCL